MATLFPTNLDSFVNPTGSSAQTDHAQQHDNINDAMAAVQTKIGKTTSAVTSSLDYLLKAGTDPGHTHTIYTTLTAKVNTVATSGAAQTIPDVITDSVSYITLTANCTFTFPTAAAGKNFQIALKQDGTGSRTVTWPGTVKWPGGTIPTLTTTVAKTDLFSFICVDGTNWVGRTLGLNY